MRFPSLTPQPRYQQTLDSFGGYNHNLRIGDHEFYDLQNLTSDRFPLLCPRKPRAVLGSGSIRGLIAKDSLCYVDGSCFVINGYRVEMGLSDSPKQLVSMGAYVIILPDNLYISTADLTDFGPIDAVFTAEAPVTFTPCRADGTPFTPDYLQPEAPKEPANMALWMDTSGQPHSLKQYSAATDTWAGVETVCVKLGCGGIGAAFRQGDGITLSGLSTSEHLQLRALEGAHVLLGREEDALTLPGILDAPVTVSLPVTLSRKMPRLDFITESGNRLWGCRYGLNSRGEPVNELYACALGDFKNWNVFQGISTDSYYVSVGSDGPFTGAVTLGGYPLFFKENCLHKVYGQMPANFQVQTMACRGVRKGSEKSLAVVEEVLYYHSAHGICAYDGSLPAPVSGQLGDTDYRQAVAAGCGSKYYVSLADGEGRRSLFVYDTLRRLWHKEDDPGICCLCPCRRELYAATEDGRLLALAGSADSGETVSWMAETGIIGGSLPENKFLLKLNLRLQLAIGSRLTVLVRYDSSGDWVSLGQLTGTSVRSFSLPLKPRRCDHLQLRLEGTGPCLVFAITKTYTQGSDRPCP